MHRVTRAARAAYIPWPGEVKEDRIGAAVELLGKAERLNVAVLHCDDGHETVAHKLG